VDAGKKHRTRGGRLSRGKAQKKTKKQKQKKRKKTKKKNKNKNRGEESPPIEDILYYMNIYYYIILYLIYIYIEANNEKMDTI
jgi:hypothetical protein